MIRLSKKLSTNLGFLVNNSLFYRLRPSTTCLLCDTATHSIYGACKGCFSDLSWNRCACHQCSEPLISAQERAGLNCGNCQSHPPPFARSVAPLLYAFPVDRCLQELKYEGLRYHARRLAKLAAPSFARAYQDDALPHYLVPVPSHAKTKRTRGYNQAELVAKHLARRLNIPLNTRLISKTEPTASQTGQDKSTRLKNLKGSFSWEQCESLSAPEHIAIVDDVMTTGATLTAVAHIAKANGVKRVDVWSIARTPKRG